jgi:RNA polymerase sigma-70 factor (ECF subfamily)
VDEKLRSGPIEAPADFEVAFREHFAPVYRFIARRVGTDLAEDLAAEAFATAYRRRASYDQDRGSLRSWLFGIAANLVREHWRDEQRSRSACTAASIPRRAPASTTACC